MPKIRRIAIRNFRSINTLEMKATDLTVIVGDNDCGKSNILRALNLFFNDETNPNTRFNFSNDYNRYTESRAKQADEIEVLIDLELPFNYRENNGDLIRWRKRWRADGLVDGDDYWGIRLEKKKRGAGFREHIVSIEGRSRVPTLLNRMQFEYVPAVRSTEFFRGLRGRIYKVIADTSERIVRESSGQFEQVISDSVSDLLKDIGAELNDDSRLSLPNDLTSIFEGLDFLAGDKSISLDNRGDGIKARYIPLILKFIAEKGKEASGILPTFIWAYEEPENNLEFRRAQELSDSFRKLAEDELSQVLLTTHSPIFYNMHNQTANDDAADNICTALHIIKEGNADGTMARSVAEVSGSLDEQMGAMSIIAPYIQAAQNALAEATDQANDLRKKLDKYNQNNLPTLFVEGATDYLVFKTLLKKFRPEQAKAVYLAEPPRRAGANYVANMLRSWEYGTKHRPLADRTKAVGIVDNDSEGRDARKRFDQEHVDWKHVSLITPETPVHLLPAMELGIEISTTLEEMWPVEIWNVAEAEGWLFDRPKIDALSEGLLKRLVDEDLKLSELIEDEWRIYYNRCVNPALELQAKSKWATYATTMPKATLERVASEHLALLDRSLAKLGAIAVEG
jgi:energy-coupling factor transporter ATP-binding protein EcfA2